MFGLFRRGIVIGSTVIAATSYGANKFSSNVMDAKEINKPTILNAPSKYISMLSKFRMNDGNGRDVDETLLYLFQSKAFESPYHSLYLCYPQKTSAVGLVSHGYGNYGSLVFDNVCFNLICIGFVVTMINMSAMFVAN